MRACCEQTLFMTLMPRLGAEAKATVLASFYHMWALQTNVFQGVSQSTTTTVANGTFSFHVHDRVFLDQLKSIRAVLSKPVFGLGPGPVMKTHLLIGLIGSVGVDIVGRLGGCGRWRGSKEPDRPTNRGSTDAAERSCGKHVFQDLLWFVRCTAINRVIKQRYAVERCTLLASTVTGGTVSTVQRLCVRGPADWTAAATDIL
jgi:hypothetical protein